MLRLLEFDPLPSPWPDDISIWGASRYDHTFILTRQLNCDPAEKWSASVRSGPSFRTRYIGKYPSRAEAVKALEDEARLVHKGIFQ